MNLSRWNSLSCVILILVMAASCGDSTAPSAGSKTNALTSQVDDENNLSSTDYVLRAEATLGNNERAAAQDLYRKAIVMAEKERNSAQAAIYTKRLTEIEKGR